MVTNISNGGKFIWENLVGDAIAWINYTGEAVFKSIQVIVASVKQLIIEDEIVVAKEAEISGSAKFGTSVETVEMETDKVKEDSLIYITPTTKINGLVLYVKEIRAGKAFIVALDQSTDFKEIIGPPYEATPSASQAIKFNWFIINQQ